MYPLEIFFLISLFLLLIETTKSTSNSPKTIVIQIKGDCKNLGDKIAQEHGYRYVRQIFDCFCELEEDPLSENHIRHRRAIENDIDPAKILLEHEHVEWAESQKPKIRQKREFVFNDPDWNDMWYLKRHLVTPNLPDLNVTGAWKMGYTGRGRVVTFLDDGLEFDHPDLQENYDKDASTDINGNDDDPTPRYEPTDENKHGTRCAGEVSAKANNQVCGVGIAYHARVGGIRMLDGDVTDSVEARSISHRPDHVEIYSASWGPDDNGLVVDGPGLLAKKAFENGVLHGRGGKGSIFVWASGNGGRASDSCACDGYITSIYTIAVSAVAEGGTPPWYLEECSATLTTAYSSGQGQVDHDIITTDLHHSCTHHHTGTSAAAPLAAAIYALVLEANPNLTWRDIMYITVLGSRPHAIPSNTEIIRNAAGFNVSNKYGFGLMDAGLMTWYASGWKNVPAMSTCESMTYNPKKTIKSESNETFSSDLTECKNSGDIKNQVNYIEQVQVYVNLSATKRGEIEIYLYSPSNTKTQILPKRANDQSDNGFSNWAFLTVQLWLESPHGQWKLQISNTGGGSAELLSWRLVVHGTSDYPISPRSSPETNQSKCYIECNPNEPCGNTDTSCTACRHYKQPLTDGKFRCVGICPEGTYPFETDKTCLPCHTKCGSCRDASENSCISCKIGFFLIHDTMICAESCPTNYYTDHKLRKCVRCKSDCASCDTNSYICTTCPVGYALKDTDCVKAAQECESSEYFDFTTNTCRWCDSRCLTCSGHESYQCNSCDKTSKFPNLQYHTCVSSCSPGFYLSKDTSQCLSCHDTCLNCTSSSESSCLSCKIGYDYSPDTHSCVKHIGKPYYIDSKTGEMLTCHSSCTQCKGPKPNDCIACNPITEVLLTDGHCVNECPAGSYEMEKKTNEIQTNICVPCPIGCKRCTDLHDCSECDTFKGYYKVGRQCFPTCDSGTFLLDGKCQPCQNPCVTCTNSTSCLTCNDKLNLLNDQCVEKCSDGYYLKNKQCLLCHPICRTCRGLSEDDCKSCADGFIFDEQQKQCLSLCPNGNFYSKDDNGCKLCTDNCLECLYPGSYCRQCSYPMSLNVSTHQCLSCCTSNITTDDCCQCPSIWDGFCLHPLVTSSTFSTWWYKAPIDKIRDKFSQLDGFHQTIIMFSLFFILILLSICFIIIIIQQFNCFCFKSKLTTNQHDDVEYVLLEGFDDDQISNTVI
ncbi:unnamed protein product [Rotaria sordida]|uniref:P/Homo B domain-containing protein n=1 Tax=Rotaria sordida TaxID=392033 RepID=A0A819NWZ1_9BILA|nr:unnamed protein product [Rotaria sordida]CAF4001455.1 unnamed protein product [Rotaria sordida]